MTLNKIRQANKKKRHESKRRGKRAAMTSQRRDTRIRKKRTQKMIKQGREEFKKRRQLSAAYVNNLEQEINEDI